MKELDLFYKIKSASIGKFKTKWYLPKTRDYKLYLVKGVLGRKIEQRYIIIPEKMAMKAVSGHVTKKLRQIEQKEDKVMNEISELSKKGATKKSREIKKLKKQLIKLETERRKIDPVEFLIGKNIRIIIKD